MSVAEPVTRPEEKQRTRPAVRPKRQPPWNVVLWDDDDHTYDYVIRMMQELFGHSLEKSFLLARGVDASGRVICLTTSREHAELKRDQIHAYGRDGLLSYCQGSMTSSIEPSE